MNKQWITIGVFLQLFVGGLLQAQSHSIESYAAQCIEQVGKLPDFSCADGVEVPVTVNEQKPTHYSKGMTCDRPALLSNGKKSDGQCVPYSRILDISNESIQAVVMCRQKHIRAQSSLNYDEIDVIAHNPATGASCWFAAIAEDAENPIDGRQVPSPTAAIDTRYWDSPKQVLTADCGGCHDNDPFMYSPFVGQVWENVPVNPLGAYYHVAPEMGFKNWPTTAINLTDNTCLGCHRIGIKKTCSSLTAWLTGRAIPDGANANAANFPLSHAMPPNHDLTLAAWDVIHKESVDNILSCCGNNFQDMCQLTPIPSYPE